MTTWRDINDQLTPEQITQLEHHERDGDDPDTLLYLARGMAADNMTRPG
jgi:hypothetical protein